MKKKLKVYVVGPDWCNITKFLLFDFEKVDSIKEADIVMFTGGEDISPALYGDEEHSTTHFSPRRDEYEVAAFEAAPKNALLIGGCRGAQLLTALSGGKLFQHVTGHSGCGKHDITTSDGRKMAVTSCHHQMMDPYDLPIEDYNLLAWSSENRSPVYHTGTKALTFGADFKEPEIVYYPKTRSLCIQGHPEWMEREQPVIGYINELIKQFI